MAALKTVPPVSTLANDLGDGQTGTVFDEAWFDAFADAIDAAIAAAPNTALAEVVTARGTTASLNDRISGVISPAGALIPTLSDPYPASQNMVVNDDFLIWDRGPGVDPAGWALSGSGGQTVDQCGLGLADATRLGGEFCARITAVGTAALTMVLGPTTKLDEANRSFGIGCYVKADAGAQARMILQSGAATIVAPYATVLNAKTWLSATGAIVASGGALTVIIEVNQPGAVYVGGVTCIFSAVAPSAWIPCPTIMHEQTLELAVPTGGGVTAAVGDAVDFILPGIGRVESVIFHARSLALASAMRVEVERWTGVGVYATMLATPLLPVATFGGATQYYEKRVPDGASYSIRCVGVPHTERIRARVTVADAATIQPRVMVRYLTYSNLLERFAA